MAGAGTGSGLASFERELICSICTEVLYQPLTILNCLHTFCGSCLKEWFSHQHRKASSSRSGSSTSNPYSCPTCRAEVRDVQHNATVSNLLELFLAANPSRNRSPEEKQEMDAIYKPDGTRPGDKILPKVERRRDRRARREDETAARERQMIEEARQRSLRELDSYATSNLAPPTTDRNRSASADREERRQRRRDRERQRDNPSTLSIPATPPPHHGHESHERASSPPVSSPRHPQAVEARQREHRMSHQASLRSLVSVSETGTGTGDSFDEARIMQEIIEEGLLPDVDVDSLTEAEQEALAERIAELYRQRHPNGSTGRSRPRDAGLPPTSSPEQPPARLHVSNEHTGRSQSASRSSPPHSANDQLLRSQPPPPSMLARSNSQGQTFTIHHRRRTSDQTPSTRATRGSRASSVERPPASSSTSNLAEIHSVQPGTLADRPLQTSQRTNTDPASHASKASEAWLQAGGGGQGRRVQPKTGASSSPSPRPAHAHPASISVSNGDDAVMVHSGIAELDSTVPPSNSVPFPPRYREPSVTCFRCDKPDIQYETHKCCYSCEVNLCMRCYREGKGCRHWYGFGHAAELNFENSKNTDDTTEPPHVLMGKRYIRPAASTILESESSSKTTGSLPRITSSNPADRLQNGHFCDRCSTFSNAQFWLCDICNDGEWGFCKDCVQAHHCCTHPLLPVAYHPQPIAEAFERLRIDNAKPGTLQPNPPPVTGMGRGSTSANNSRPHTPSSATSNRSKSGAGYDYLFIDITCDMCHQAIITPSPYHHCPSHNADFDVCESCYKSFLQRPRMRSDTNSNATASAGWRKCPLGHRMVVLAFEPDISEEGDGGMRRVVKHDLVGGWKMSDADIRAWNAQHNLYASPPTSPPLSGRGTWTWNEDGSRRMTRTRTSTLTSTSNGIGNNGASNAKFPPEGGFGHQGVAYYAYWPEDGEDGQGELRLPRGAHVGEMEDVNGDWWSGVYAGDVGVFPFGYVREYK